jgi:ATP-dependent protease HslVU (ClpYQ) peptidase subunit
MTLLVWLSAANFVAILAGSAAIIFGLLPKLERTVQTTERVEARFQKFADEVQPVLTAGAGKAVEAIQKIDANRLSKTATEKTDKLLDAAAERAKRFIDSDKKDK